ncbi:MAG TPA: phosphoribosyltransferase family protein [Candidatus Saccharimonadales bacterium]|nr:phosphoribosyltransferase family protein [Candidatus Saccharimonadales bacterium]
MYFASRSQAGRMLASQIIDKYNDEKCAVLALGDGGAMVGVQIALEMHCILTMLNSAEIMLPREPLAIAGITAGGDFTFNREYAAGDLEELVTENYNLIEQEKLQEMHNLNYLEGPHGTVKKSFLNGHSVIVVSDGLKSGFPVDLTAEFLKPVSINKLIVAVPFAGIQAVDRMHVLADDLFCLTVLSDYISTDHYYDKQDVPDHGTVMKSISQIVNKWQ